MTELNELEKKAIINAIKYKDIYIFGWVNCKSSICKLCSALKKLGVKEDLEEKEE